MIITVLLSVAAVVTLGASQTTPPALEPASCPLEDQIAFSLTLPNARVCAPSIGAVLTPVSSTPTNLTLRSMLIDNLDTVCVDSCGGKFVDYLASESCNDTFGATTLEVFCTVTNGAAAAGPYCRFAALDIDQTITDTLLMCDNSTICASGCREALLKTKSQIGCCYQSMYNNTRYLTELFIHQFIPQFAFDRFSLLNDPLNNPWNACNVIAPQECTGEPFALEPASCPLEDQIAFSLTLPNSRVCAPSIGAVLTPVSGTPTNLTLRSMLLDNLDTVCIDSCGGKFVDYLASESCNDTFGATTLKVFCTVTNGAAAAGPYCRFAALDIDQTITDTLLMCDNSTICASGCREALLKTKSQIGCCYQSMYNNTRYLTELFINRFIPQFAFDRFSLLNDPLNNPWNACNVIAPQECTGEPFGCSTCRMNSTCKPECPAPSSSEIQQYSAILLCIMFLVATFLFGQN